MNTEENIMIESNDKSDTSSNILIQLDKIAEKQTLQVTGDSVVISKKNVAFGAIKPFSDKPVTIFSSPHPQNTVVNISSSTIDKSITDTSTASIYLPQDVTQRANNDLIYTFAFKSGLLFLTENSSVNTTLQSIVLSASVGKNIANLSIPIELTFTATKITEGYINVCKYWDSKMTSANESIKGGWSSEGCKTITNISSNKVHCECNHLTNFAILLDVSQTGANPLALQVITWIGCGLSIAGLFLTVLTFSAFR